MNAIQWSAALVVSGALALAGCHRSSEAKTSSVPPAAMAAGAEQAPPSSAVKPAGAPARPAAAAREEVPTPEDVAKFNQRVPK